MTIAPPHPEPNLLTRRIGPCTVTALGLGCMNLSHAYRSPPSAEAARALLHQALDGGITHFDTAALYGFGANEELIGPVLAPHRARITLASKGGMAGVLVDGRLQRVIDGRPEAIRRDCEASLRRLGTEVIDLYYLHRLDKSVPIEDSVGEMARLCAQGKVRALGLSEVSAATLRRAHAVHPIAAVQSEYSLWTRNPELGVLQACREIGAALVAFSPLARGFLTSAPPDPATFEPADIRRTMPRFEAQPYAANLALLPAYHALAAEAGCTPAQLALAWVLAQGEHVLAIPGTASAEHLAENLGAGGLVLDAGLLARAGELINAHTVQGRRYGAQSERESDAEPCGAAG